MRGEQVKSKAVWIMVALGIAVSIFSFLENRWPPLAALCAIFGSGCRQAADFTLLQLPVAVWGTMFYAALAMVNRFARPWMFGFVMAGVGVEATLVWLMLSRSLVCVFCLFNALVMAVLLVLFTRSSKLWQCTTIVLMGCLASNYLLARENPLSVSTQTPLKGSSVVMNVNGRQITLTDLETGIAAELNQMRNDIYRLKLERLEALIQALLSQGQGRGQMPSEQAPPSTEGEQEDPLQRAARQIITESTKSDPQINQYLEKPLLPHTRITIGDSPFKGPADALVTVIEFSDYLCPVCRWAHPINKEIQKTYQGKVRWVFKDFPLKNHKGADKLAEAARCANDQGRFWEFQDLLFDAKDPSDPAILTQVAQSLSMDTVQFNQCVESTKYGQEVMNDKQDASQAGVVAIPSYIINGRLHTGAMSLNSFKMLMEESLTTAP